ncbi:murein biosynthesis integral membrane protein MurJ [Candidatus Uhrbacteria bacterium]|nr:murein biosynthesis integral membrane protein MurJ [Candidatus Uhrbacteria bacterium]
MLKILNGESKSITSAALVVGAASLFSRLIGLLRDRILAGEFGAGEQLDIYFAAFRIPDFLFQLLIVGALSAGFIPLFARLQHDHGDRAWVFAGSVLHIVMIILAVMGALLALIAGWVVPLMTPGFSHAAQSETIVLTRIMLVSPIFLGMSAVFGGILQTFKQFFVNALAPIFYNIGIIVGALYGVPYVGLMGLAWGVVFGAFLHACIQIPSVYRLGFRYHTAIARMRNELLTLCKLMVPRVFALAMTQGTLVAMTMIASTLTAGSLAMFNFANNMASLPIGIFGISYAIAAFPTFTEHVVRGDTDRFRRSLAATVRHVLFFLIPCTVLFILLRAQIVRAVLGAGAFDWEDTIHTMNTLAAFAVGMVAVAINFILIRGFWAYEDTRTPAIIVTLGSVLSVVVAVFAAPYWGVEALGAAITMGSVLQLGFSWLMLRRHTGTLCESVIFISLAKITVGTFALALGVQGAKMFFGVQYGTATLIEVVLQGGIASLIGIALYIMVCWLLQSRELMQLIASVRRRIAPNSEQLELFEQ